MALIDRTSVEQDARRFVKRFYKDWRYYSDKYANSSSSSGVTYHGNVYDKSVLTWRSPMLIKHEGRLSERNLLNLSLRHPTDCISNKVQFDVTLTMCFDRDNTADSVTLTRVISINPTPSLHSSIILTKILLSISALIGQEVLDGCVSRSIITILNSMQRGILTPSGPLYEWTPEMQLDPQIA